MSYDDGSEHDRRLVEIFNRYGIRASFHLNSGKLDLPHHVRRDEVASLYRGHEVSCHTVTHPDLTRLPDDAVRGEIAGDRRALRDASGQAVRGLAYPFGAYDDRVARIAREEGIAYARTAHSTGTFALPADALAWAPTCHHGAAMDLVGPFLDDAGDGLMLLYVWGHSYELDGFMTSDASRDWRYIDELCRRLHGHDSVWYATSLELADYLAATAGARR